MSHPLRQDPDQTYDDDDHDFDYALVHGGQVGLYGGPHAESAPDQTRRCCPLPGDRL